MKILGEAASEPRVSTVVDYDRYIVLGYAVLACLALIAIWAASGGPSFSTADFESLAAMP